MRIEDAISKFLVQLEADGRSSHTRRQYARHLRTFATWARDVALCGDDLEALDHEVVAAFLASSAAMGRADGGRKKSSSANCVRSSVRGFLKYIHEAGLTGRDHGRLIRRARCSPPPPRGLSDSEARMLLETVASASGDIARRDHAIIHVFLATGIRVGSAVALDVEDVDLDRRELVLRSAKGDAPQVAYLADGIAEHLAGYISNRPGGALFTDSQGRRLSVRHVQRLFAAWGKRAGIQRAIHPHEARHAFAQRVHARSGDLLLTKQALNHKSIASTTVYARVSEERLRAAL